MDKEKIKKAMDHFENDEFTKAKDILKKEIHQRKNDWLKDKLDLKNDVEPKPEEKDKE